VYVHLPFMVLPLYANLESTIRRCSAAQDLGRTDGGATAHYAPLSLPGVYAGAALVSSGAGDLRRSTSSAVPRTT
jgi:spermidine/putrescine transport system permease protein